jgi:monoamine oxidase
MAYTKLLATIRRALTAHAEAKARGIPISEVRSEWRERSESVRTPLPETTPSVTRREFLAAGIAGGALVAGYPLRGLASTPRVVVVGAGLAGLRFAHVLWHRRGFPCAIYEGSNRIGGRVWTNRDFFVDGQLAEHGAEFISSEHRSTLRLAKHFGLQLAVVNGGSEPGFDDVSWVRNAYYTQRQLDADLQEAMPAINAAFNAAPFPTLYNSYTKAGYMLDHASALDWIKEHIEGGADSNLGQVLLSSLLAEYGGEPSKQSSLNLIYLLGGGGTGGFGSLAGTDEKYHILGGNDQLATMMADELPRSPIEVGAELIALKRNSDGTYVCTFQRDAGTFEVTADHVVLAVPFTTLKRVDLTKAGFSALKTVAIENYLLGTNAKLSLQFNSRPWMNPDGYSGVCYTGPSAFQVCWDATVAQKGPSGILVDFLGGRSGGPGAFPGADDHGPAPTGAVQGFLSEVEGPFPGCLAAYNGRAYLDWWATDRFHYGAYAYYQLGQYTRFAGYERVREGNVHFCGEHTSIAFQGFIEGAVRSAERIALDWPNL